ALAMANMKNTSVTFSTNQTTPGIQVNGGSPIGGSQPPRNRIVVMAHIRMIEMYSPSMNSRYGVEEYSTMNPATSSDSASGRSKGGRFVSASAEMKKITNTGNSGSQNQLRKLSQGSPIRCASPISRCAVTMSERFSEPTQSSTVMMTKPIETS